LLWLDLTRSAAGVSAVPGTVGRYRTTAIFDWDAMPCAIRAHLPDALGIEFDQPELTDLAPIGDIARGFPGLPIVVVSAGHSEALVLQAMRMRAWDFLVKPLGPSELYHWIDAVLLRVAAIRGGRAAAECGARIAPDACSGDSGARTAPAVAYVAERFRDHVTLSAAADHCHLSVSQFSRLFKREQGVTFSHFVAGMRIRHACDLLSRSPAPVKQVGFGVGFSDLAYFSRAFRRLVGVCPSEFRSTAHKP
jgi:AraC-like DNA-binding protein